MTSNAACRPFPPLGDGEGFPVSQEVSQSWWTGALYLSIAIRAATERGRGPRRR